MMFTIGLMPGFATAKTFTATGITLTGNSKAATTTVVGTNGATAIVAGRFVIVAVASDNTGTTDAAGQDDIVGVTDSAGSTYTFAAGYRNGQGAAQAGAHASLWYTVLTSPIAASTGTITVTNTTSSRARCFSASVYSLVGGSAVTLVSSIGAAGDGGTDPVCTLSGLDGLPGASRYLYAGSVADENNSAPFSASGYGLDESTFTTGGGGATTHMASALFTSHVTSTSSTLTPGTTGDAAAVLVAFKVT